MTDYTSGPGGILAGEKTDILLNGTSGETYPGV